MRAYSLTHVGDQTLLRDLAALVQKDRATTAALLAHIAEVDARRLYVPAGHPSMYAYCVTELRLSEDAAYKRIRAARTARRFPALFPALADGRLHLSAVVLLAPYLTPENADEMVTVAALKTKSEIELLLAQRFPKPDLPQVLREQHAPGHVEARTARPTDQLAPGRVGTVPPRVKPLSPNRFALQLTVEQRTHDKLQYARELLSHQIPSGDLAQVLDRALDALIGKLEKRKFAATDRPRTAAPRRPVNKRTIPAHVKREVWARDGGQCTFVSEAGKRCAARTLLEFDHVEPVARGGQATAKTMRLRCRAHNQYEAECAFGAGFMHDKRESARHRRKHRQAAAAEQDVMACLRTLGFRADESRRALAFSPTHADATLEDRVRVALSWFRPRAYSHPTGHRREAPAPPGCASA